MLYSFMGLLVVGSLFSNSVFASDISTQFKKLDIAENLSFTGASRWDYKINKTSGNSITIKFPEKLSASSVSKIKGVTGKYIQSAKVLKNELTGAEVQIKLRKNVSYFDYLTDQPSSLVIDFYEDKAKKAKAIKKTSKKIAKNKKSNQRKPASTEFISFDQIGKDIDKILNGDNDNSLIRTGVFDSADPNYGRFEIPVREFDYTKINENLKKDVFMKFPILYRESNQLKTLLSDLPLHIIRTKNNKETKEAQLIHKLYTSKVWAAFHKMYQYFTKAYPDSKYENLLRSLATSAYFELWKNTNDKHYLNLAEKEFLKFKKDLPENRVTEYWDKIMFYTSLQLKHGLEAARRGEAILKKYPLAEDLEKVRLNLADAYLQASQFTEARRVYKGLVNSDDPFVKKEAQFSLPIVDFKQDKMNIATSKYIEAKKNYPLGDDPSYYFNMGEAYFWQGEYKKSAELYKQFIKKYPKHFMNNYAITRIGEIMSLVGYPIKKYKPMFLESVYRFKGLKGADIAEMRINSLKVGKRKAIESDHYISEIKRLASKYDDIEMRYFEEIIIADSLTRSEKYLPSNEYLIKSYKRNPYSKIANQIKPRIIDNLQAQMEQYLRDNQYLSVIELYESNRSNWLAKSKKLGFKRILARSFELAGMNNYSLAHYVDYVDNKKKANLPISNQVILSMATLYQKNKDYENMDKYLKVLSNMNNLTDQEKYQAVKLKFDVFKEKGVYDRAEKLITAYNNSNITNVKVKADTVFSLSDFYRDRAKYNEALKELKKVESTFSENSEFFYPLSKRIIKLQLDNSNDSEALNKVDQIIGHKDFLKDEPFIFFVGDLLLKNNEREKADEVWSKISDKKSMYVEMIKEKKKHNNWQKSYGKYIDRIPAMNE